MKKIFFSLLAFFTAISLSGCGSTASSSATEEASASATVGQHFNPGTYTGTAEGIRSTVKMDVTFSEDKITDITINEQGESPNISDAAFDQIPKEILDTQSLDVDAVTSVTFTSNAIINAVKDAAQQAGGNMDLLTEKRERHPQESETIDCDVVIVGAGLAGLSAAASAIDQGAKTVVVEKAGAAGGSSKYSGGFITAVGTKQAEAEGVTITADDYLASYNAQEDLSVKEDETDRSAMADMINRSASDIEFLEDHDDPIAGPDGFGTDFKVWHYPATRTSAFDGDAAGADHIAALMKWLNAESGFQIYYNTPATHLLTDGNTVTGVECERKDGSVLTVNAKAVVLASGGWAASPDMMARFCPDFPQEWVLPYTTSSMYNTGDGITMAEEVNADVYENGWWMDLAIEAETNGATTYFPGTLNHAINYANYFVTDGTGKRILNVNSLYGPRSIVFAQAMKDTGAIWSIYTSEGNSDVVDFIENNNKVDDKIVYKADSIEELANKTGMDPTVLQENIDTYNGYCASGTDEDLGQTTLIPIGDGPYYAISIKTSTMGTIGGLKTDDNKSVLDKNGDPIKGLYAAGELINGKYFNQVYTSGCAQLLALDSGIIAGANAAGLSGSSN